MEVDNAEVVSQDILAPENPPTLQEQCDAGDMSACAQLRPVVSEEPEAITDEEMNALVNQEVIKDVEQPVEEIQTTEPVVMTDEEMNALVNQEVTVAGEPSTSRKISYGASSEPMILGSLSRLIETGYETAFEGKTWDKAREDTEQERLNELYTAYPEFASGKYDSDGSVLAGRVSTALVDPVTFFMPWTKAAKAGLILKTAVAGEKTSRTAKVTSAIAGKTPLMALGAGVSGGEFALHEYARKGEVDTDMLIFVMGAGGLLTVAVEPFAKKLITGYNNKFGKHLTAEDINKATSAEEVKKILGIRNVDKLTPKQLKDIDDVFELPHLRDLNDLTRQSTNNVQRLDSLRAARNELGKLVKNGKITKRVAKNRNAKLTQQFDESITKMIDRRSDAIIEITEHLYKTRSLTAKTFEVATRPVVGSLMMGGIGVLTGQDDDTLKTMMLSGLLLGHVQKRIQNSTFMPQELKKEIVTNIFKRHWEIQKRNIKIITAGTHVTKLKAMGEETSLFADLMHHTFSPKGTRQLSVEERANMATQFWNIILKRDVLKDATQDTQQAAIRFIRGFGTKKEQTKEVKEVAARINSFLKKYKSYHEEVNIKAADDLKNYFPREFNFEAIKTDSLILPINHPAHKEFNGLSMLDVVKKIIKKQNPKMKKDAVATKANNYMLSLRSFDKDTIMEAISKTGDTKFKVRKLPLIKHLEQSRELHGTIKIKGKVIQVEELINPWLKSDATEVLSNMVKESSKTVEFARTFGSKGEVLQNILRRINKKYEDTVDDAVLHHKHQKELKRITDGVDAFFGRYGTKRYRFENNIGAWASLYNATLMLEDVTLANLGDLIQPFQNSQSLRSVWKGLKLTSGRAKTSATRDDIEPAAVLGIIESDIMAIEARASAGMGDAGGVVRHLSDGFYQATGLHKITSFARRFAFNSGTQDAFLVSKQWATLRKQVIRQVERDNSVKWARLSQKKKIELFKHTAIDNKAFRDINLKLNYFGIDDTQAKAIAQFNDFGSAYANKDLRSIFHMAGFRAMERDSKIPTVGNRLLFTQSRDPRIRILGQFSSWAQAKTAQTNALIKRIESGDGKLMVKMIGALTIYSGIRELRDMVKEGTIDTKTHTFPEVVARANDLSGNPGIWSGYVTQVIKASNLQNTGYNPLTMFPTGSTIMESIKQISAEDPDFNRLTPLPKLRNLIKTLMDEGHIPRNVTVPDISFPDYPIPQYSQGGLVSQAERLGFSKGGGVSLDNTSISKESQILVDNETVPFVDRIINPQNYPTPAKNKDGSISTHLLSAEEDEDGSAYVFPTKTYKKSFVKRPEQSYTQYDDNYKALDVAKTEGNVIKFDSIEEAVSFSKNYKPKSFLDYYGQKPSFTERMSEDYSKREDASTQSYIDNKTGKISRFRRAINNVGNLAGLGFDVAGNLIESSVDTYLENLEAFAPKGYKKISKDLKEAKTWVLNTEAGQYAVEKATLGLKEYSNWKRDNPQDAQTFESVLNIGMGSWVAKGMTSQMSKLKNQMDTLNTKSTYQYKPNSDTPYLDMDNEKINKVNKFFNPDVINKALQSKDKNTKVVYMTPGEFLTLAKTHTSDGETKKLDRINNAINEGIQLEDIPTLTIKAGKDGNSQVTKHDGRHRANALYELGEDLIPVRVKTTDNKDNKKLSTVTNEDGLEVYTFPAYSSLIYDRHHLGTVESYDAKKEREVSKKEREVSLRAAAEGLTKSGGFKYKLPTMLLDLTIKKKIAPSKPSRWKYTLSRWTKKGKIKKEELDDSRLMEWLESQDKDKKISTKDIFTFMQDNSPMLKTYTSKIQSKADTEWLNKQPLQQEKIKLEDNYHNKFQDLIYVRELFNIPDISSDNEQLVKATAQMMHHVLVEDIINEMHSPPSIGNKLMDFLSNSPYTLKAIQSKGVEATLLSNEGFTSNIFHPEHQQLDNKEYIREAAIELVSELDPEKRNSYIAGAIIEDLNQTYLKAEGREKEGLSKYVNIFIDTYKAKRSQLRFGIKNVTELRKLSEEAMERTSGDVSANTWGTFALANTRGKPVTILVQSKIGKEDRLKKLKDFTKVVNEQSSTDYIGVGKLNSTEGILPFSITGGTNSIAALEHQLDLIEQHIGRRFSSDGSILSFDTTKERIKIKKELQLRKKEFYEKTGIKWEDRQEYVHNLEGNIYQERHWTGTYMDSPLKKGIPQENIILHIRGNIVKQGSLGKGNGLFINEQQAQPHQTAMANKKQLDSVGNNLFKNSTGYSVIDSGVAIKELQRKLVSSESHQRVLNNKSRKLQKDFTERYEELEGKARAAALAEAKQDGYELTEEELATEVSIRMEKIVYNNYNMYDSQLKSIEEQQEYNKKVVSKLNDQEADLSIQIRHLTNSLSTTMVDAIPENLSHKKDWTPLAMKQAIKYSIDNDLNYIVLPIEKHSIQQIEQWGDREPGVMQSILDRNSIYSPRAYRSIVKKWDKDAKPFKSEYLDKDVQGDWDEGDIHKVIVLPITDAIRAGYKKDGLTAYRRGGLVTQMKALTLNA